MRFWGLEKKVAMYDVYLWDKASSLPNLADLTLNISEQVVIEEKCRRVLDEHPGFLGLDLSFEHAADLLKCIESQGAHGRVAASKYRHPEITLETAYSIAAKTIQQRQKKKYPGVDFESIQLSREEVMWWEFFAASEKWLEDGHTPGGLIVCVDKVDGHVWRHGEFSRLYGEDRLPSSWRGRHELLRKRISAFSKIRTLRGKLRILIGLFNEWLSWHLGLD